MGEMTIAISDIGELTDALGRPINPRGARFTYADVQQSILEHGQTTPLIVYEAAEGERVRPVYASGEGARVAPSTVSSTVDSSRQPAVDKSAAIRAFLAANPDAVGLSISDLHRLLASNGVDASRALVGRVARELRG